MWMRGRIKKSKSRQHKQELIGEKKQQFLIDLEQRGGGEEGVLVLGFKKGTAAEERKHIKVEADGGSGGKGRRLPAAR